MPGTARLVVQKYLLIQVGGVAEFVVADVREASYLALREN
ncbi:hypothetical protein FLA_0104 [Filimonas lacunae]|nr:hypothetical protein FLA_0104 [Filimonas lacunae]